MPTSENYEIVANNPDARFTLKVHRGDGMALLAMDWKEPQPPADFVGFAIEYREPGGDRLYPLRNRITFPKGASIEGPAQVSSLVAPFQKFRWVHFPRNADREGPFQYKVTPVFMNEAGDLSYGIPQTADIVLARETYPGLLNVAFTRGFVSSQAFLERFVKDRKSSIKTLLPESAEVGIDFHPTHPKATEALEWMGFEARSAILELLQSAIDDPTAQVSAVCFELSEPVILGLMEKLKGRLRVILDDSENKAHPESAESQAAARLALSAGADHVKRQQMGRLQHNKFIVVDGERVQAALCGSTNFSWRGLYVQANNALVLRGKPAIQPFKDAFENYWQAPGPAAFAKSPSARWSHLGLKDIDATVTFSPHSKSNAVLRSIANDIRSAKSSVFYSLAFLGITKGAVTEAIKEVTLRDDVFVYGIADQEVEGLNVQLPSGRIAPVHPAALTKNLPEPFKSEPAGGNGVRMHHKFVVIDFNLPSARVYAGSFNFSNPADTSNGENLVLIKDRRVAVSYMVQALSLFDHYHFRLLQAESATRRKRIELLPAPAPGQDPWWHASYHDPRKVLDRRLFA